MVVRHLFRVILLGSALIWLGAPSCIKKTDSTVRAKDEHPFPLAINDFKTDPSGVYLELVKRSIAIQRAGGLASAFPVPEWSTYLWEATATFEQEVNKSAMGKTHSVSGVKSPQSQLLSGFDPKKLPEARQALANLIKRRDEILSNDLTYHELLHFLSEYSLAMTNVSLDPAIKVTNKGFAQQFIAKSLNYTLEHAPRHFVIPFGKNDTVSKADFIMARAAGVTFAEVPSTSKMLMIDGVVLNPAIFFGHDLFHQSQISLADVDLADLVNRAAASGGREEDMRAIAARVAERRAFFEKLMDAARSSRTPDLAEDFIFYLVHEADKNVPEDITPAVLTADGLAGYFSPGRKDYLGRQFARYLVANAAGAALQKHLQTATVIDFLARVEGRVRDLDQAVEVMFKKIGPDWDFVWQLVRDIALKEPPKWR